MAVNKCYCRTKHDMKCCPWYKIAKECMSPKTFKHYRHAFLMGHKIDVEFTRINGKIDMNFIIKP